MGCEISDAVVCVTPVEAIFEKHRYPESAANLTVPRATAVSTAGSMCLLVLCPIGGPPDRSARCVRTPTTVHRERSSRSPPTYGRGAGSKGVAATAERRKMQVNDPCLQYGAIDFGLFIFPSSRVIFISAKYMKDENFGHVQGNGKAGHTVCTERYPTVALLELHNTSFL